MLDSRLSFNILPGDAPTSTSDHVDPDLASNPVQEASLNELDKQYRYVPIPGVSAAFVLPPSEEMVMLDFSESLANNQYEIRGQWLEKGSNYLGWSQLPPDTPEAYEHSDLSAYVCNSQQGSVNLDFIRLPRHIDQKAPLQKDETPELGFVNFGTRCDVGQEIAMTSHYHLYFNEVVSLDLEGALRLSACYLSHPKS